MNIYTKADCSGLKKDYESPTVEVIRMECEGAIMTGSGVTGSGSNVPFEAYYDPDLANEVESLTEMISE